MVTGRPTTAPVRRSPDVRLGALLIVVSAVGFGAMAIFARAAYDGGGEVLAVVWMRFVLAAVVLHVVLRVRRLPLPRGRTLLALAALGGVGYVGQSMSYFSALTLAPAGIVALLLYLNPVFVTVLATATGRERWTRGRVVALSLATAGTALTVGPTAVAWDPRTALGMGLAVLAAVIYSFYIVLSERPTARAGALPSSTVVVTAAAVVLTVPALASGSALPTTTGGWLAVVAIAVVSTVVAIIAFFAGLRRLGPSSAATLSTLEPVVTVVLAAIVLAEAFTPLQVAGGALILVAAVLLVRSHPTTAP
ncbi:multidrug DMT transporter permease [Actinotalea ferrariae CF5-4]|uniref:Multidrug DMT transporter permease n=1 Tax=Actinotalea ferrariae CF5-4 TaxID=948458 RepID=A0A021W1J8_9CELL|nr:DMT family transporter [Actinotalea ferrariae]EYR65202.1 multidrug DMT transporter permease [Actinotalea ferrariae CF5-4]